MMMMTTTMTTMSMTKTTTMTTMSMTMTTMNHDDPTWDNDANAVTMKTIMMTVKVK
jgi:hypothetical protein